MGEATIFKPELNGQEISIDYAKPDDAIAILTLKRDAWLANYPNKEYGITLDDMHKKFTDEMLRDSIGNWQQAIANEVESGNIRTFVARIDGEVVGYTQPCIEAGRRRVGALYVSPNTQGLGIGSELLEKALQWHGPDKDYYLNVVRYREDAKHLYKKFGFQETGVERPGQFDKEQSIKLLPDIEMVRKAVN
jgi:GNAT superfamily N-acetyltransferase